MRLPDFIIIGAMKAGTTSLFNWLGVQSEVVMPQVKEPNFFSDDVSWRRGPEYYSSFFQDVPETKLTGEASVAYTDSGRAERVAERLKATIPSIRLIYVVRHPLDRLRSHFAHEVQRGRERRPFEDALISSVAPYIRRSCYFTCLEPFLNSFDREQLCVIRFEDLVGPEETAWTAVLGHLGLPPRRRPAEIHNVTGIKPSYTRLMLRLWEQGLLSNVDWVPAWLRAWGKKVLTRRPEKRPEALAIPDTVQEIIWEDVLKFERVLGLETPLWDRKRG